MNSADYFGLAATIFAARITSEKAAFRWMLVFLCLNIASLLVGTMKDERRVAGQAATAQQTTTQPTPKGNTP